MKKLTLLPLLPLPLLLVAQHPFVCDGSFYVANSHRLYRIAFDKEADTVKLTPLPQYYGIDSVMRAISYSSLDNYIYGFALGSNDSTYLCRIDSSGAATVLDTVPLGPMPSGNGIYAADITPDGKYMIGIIGVLGFDEPSSGNRIIKIELTSSNYEQEYIDIEKLEGLGPAIVTGDIAFSPITKVLYGYDVLNVYNTEPDTSGHRIVVISYEDGYIDNTLFGRTTYDFGRNAKFFDPFGKMYGISGISFNLNSYWIEYDVMTGNAEAIMIGPFVNQDPATNTLHDGCSCPYILAMEKTATPDSTYACTEVTFTYRISNLSRNLQDSVFFRDSLPPGFQFVEILRNPFSGTASGLNSNILEIAVMNLPYGMDSVIVKISVPEGAEGEYPTQALLSNADLSGTNQSTGAIRSDYPPSLAKPDPTPLTILPLEIDLAEQDFELCPDSSILLRPVEDTTGLRFQWSTGSTTSELEISQAGSYAVTVTGGCEADTAVFKVVASPLAVLLGPDREGQFGDLLEIVPDYEFLSPIIAYAWEVNAPNSLSCPDCPETTLSLSADALLKIAIQSEAGCIATDELNIAALRKIYVPNTFSPNDDGFNDLFYIQSKNDLTIREFKVFDRWGDLLFSSENSLTNRQETGWNGMARGKKLAPSVYAWFAEVEFPDGASVVYSGEVILME